MTDTAPQDRKAELEQVIDRLRKELGEAEAELLALKVAEAPFQVGDKVEAKARGRWGPAEVSSVTIRSWGQPWYHVRPYRKDGTLGIAVNAYGDVRKPA